ncbi:hypothetical protein A9Q75_16470, partial [Colwellia psychrerythraea]
DGSEGITVQLPNYINGADGTIAASFTIDGFNNTSVEEDVVFTSTVPSLSGDDNIGAVIWTITGDDANLFVIEPTTGVLSLAAQDFEIPADSDANNTYQLTVVATDSVSNFAELAVVISVTDVDEVLAYLPAEISGDNGAIASIIEAGGLTFIRPSLAAETTLDGGATTVEGNKWKLFNWAEAQAYCGNIAARLPTKTELSDNLLPLVNDADLVSNGSFAVTEHWLVNKGYWASTSPSADKHHIMKTSIDPAKMSSLTDTNRQYVTCVR